MAISGPTLDYYELQKLTKVSVCGRCGSSLTVAWVDGQYALRCGKDIKHNTLRDKNRVPEYLISEVSKLMTTELKRMDETRMLARVNQAKFPQQLNPNEKQTLVRAALDYGLDPLMGELTIYQGKPFVSIDGRVRKAHETNQFEGIESRPANEDERKARGTAAGNKLWRSEVFKKGCTHGFVGWGEVKESEMHRNENLPTTAWPDRMAEKRSQVMALRLAFYLPLPSFEDIGAQLSEPQKPFIESTAKEIKPPITDAEMPTDEAFEYLESASKTKNHRDPATIKTVGDLFQACYEEWKMTKDEVLREINKSQRDIQDPAEEYKIVASVR